MTSCGTKVDFETSCASISSSVNLQEGERRDKERPNRHTRPVNIFHLTVLHRAPSQRRCGMPEGRHNGVRVRALGTTGPPPPPREEAISPSVSAATDMGRGADIYGEIEARATCGLPPWRDLRPPRTRIITRRRVDHTSRRQAKRRRAGGQGRGGGRRQGRGSVFKYPAFQPQGVCYSVQPHI